MKFKFRLEKVLQHRKTERDVAHRDFLHAQKNYDDGVARLNQLHDEISDAKRLESDLVQTGGQPAETLKWSYFFIEGQKHKIENQRRLNRELIQELERKHEVLIEKARDFKIIETLKEKRRERFVKEMKKLDMKSIDEIVVMSSSNKRVG